MKSSVHAVALFLFCTLAPVRAVETKAAPPFGPVTVRVLNPAGVAREQWPLSFTVPFPRGVLRDAAAVGITDESGSPLPVQARALTPWPDGSVRWLLVDTQVSIADGAERRLQIKPQSRSVVPAQVRVTEGSDHIEVDTGAIRIRVSKTRGGIIDSLQLASGQAAGGPLDTVLVAGDRVGTTRPPKRVTILESGPLRVRLQVAGDYGNGFEYAVRLDAYAGQPFLRVQHTFTNLMSVPYVAMPRLAVEWPVAAPAASGYAFGVEKGGVRTGELKAGGVRLYQPDNLSYRIDGQEASGKLPGWAEVRGKKVTMGVAARWFWQEYPQSIVLQPDRFIYNLWAPEAPPAKVGMGAAKTHEFVIWVRPGNDKPPKGWADKAQPLVGAVDPEWIARSRALPQAIVGRGPAAKFVDAVVEAAGRYLRRNEREPWDDHGDVWCASGGAERRRVGAYGMWNWGDWNFPGYQDAIKGCDAWGNLEYDTGQVLALAFAASGRAELYEATVAAARHFMDVDTIHFYPPRPSWVGMNHPKNPLHFSFELGGVDPGHTWTEGLLSYFYLTGDDRALTAARGIADYLVARLQGVIVRGNPRQWGWPQIALVAVYDATGERQYLDAARQYAQGGMRAHPPTAVSKWKLGVLADALAYTHAATRDPTIEKWLRQYVREVMRRKARHDARMYPALAYVAMLDGDAALRRAALVRVEELDFGSWGKPFSINGRIGFRIHALLESEPPVTPAGAATEQRRLKRQKSKGVPRKERSSTPGTGDATPGT